MLGLSRLRDRTRRIASGAGRGLGNDGTRQARRSVMKASKLMMAMVCCAMAMPAMAQEHKPDAGKKDVKAVQPAGDKKAEMPAMSAEDKAWMEAGTPGKMHEWIAKGAGTWDCTVKMMMPGEPVQESKGTMTTQMVFGGRYAHSMFKGTFMGQPFEGAATLGFNNATGKFESTWVDSMSTGTMFTTGTLDKDGKVMTMAGECMDPSAKKMFKQRSVTTWKNDNEMTEEFFHEKDGKEAKVMEITYVRAKAAAKEKDAMDKMKGDADKLKKQGEDAIKQIPTKK
jgi:hypothetical protein